MNVRSAHLAFFVVALAAWPTSLSADDFEDCENADELISTEPSRAVSACRTLAERGNAGAQNNLGVMYHNGLGVPQDYVAAFNWYRKAADQGYAIGQYNLGQLYDDGLGVTEDDDQAEYWYRRAAEQGDAEAQHKLATLLYESWWSKLIGNAEAVQWYHKAAEQGLAEAQFDLGVMYATGRGVRPNLVQAYVWFDLAARAFPAGAEQDDAITQRGNIASELSSAELTEGMRLVREWKPTTPAE